MSYSDFFQKSALLIGIVILAVSCSSDSNDDPLFPDPVGFTLLNEGVTILTYENGSYEYNPAGIAPDFEYEGKLMLSVDHEGGNVYEPRYYTTDILIRFHDAQGNAIDYPQERRSDDFSDIHPEGEYRLEWEWMHEVDNRFANIEQHGDMGSWLFHFRADQPGETGVTFKLYRCEGDRTLVPMGDRTDPNNPQRVIRECSVNEVKIFEADAPLLIHVDDYEGVVDGRYPHDRHYRIR